MYDRITSNGNGNKSNMRIATLENLLKATEATGASARVSPFFYLPRRLCSPFTGKGLIIKPIKRNNRLIKKRGGIELRGRIGISAAPEADLPDQSCSSPGQFAQAGDSTKQDRHGSGRQGIPRSHASGKSSPFPFDQMDDTFRYSKMRSPARFGRFLTDTPGRRSPRPSRI